MTRIERRRCPVVLFPASQKICFHNITRNCIICISQNHYLTIGMYYTNITVISFVESFTLTINVNRDKRLNGNICIKLVLVF